MGLTSASSINPTGLAATAPNFAALVANGTYINTPTTVAPQTVPPTAQSNIGVAGTGLGGTYDLSRFQTILLQQKQKALAGSVTADIIGDAVVFFAYAQVAENKSFTQFRPVTTGVSLPQGSPFNPITGTLGGVIFGSPANPKQYYNRNDSFRITAGLKGKLEFLGPSWNYEAAAVHSVNVLDQSQKNVIYQPNAARSIAGGFNAAGVATPEGAFSQVYSAFSPASPLVLVPALDPLSRTPNATTLGYLFGTENLHATSQLDSFDGKVTGSLITLPAGNTGGAFVSNPSTWIGGQSADPFPVACSTAAAGSATPGGRRIISVYGEARVPITGDGFDIPGFHEFDLIGAIRHEHYSDAGNSTVPKIGFFWQPIDKAFTLRGTYSRSFTAPPLYQGYGPINNRLAGPDIVPAAFPGLAAGLTPVQDGVNPGLKPAKAQSYSIGGVFKPAFVPRLRIEADYSFIKEAGFPGGIGFSNIFLDVNQNGAASIFAGNIAKGNFRGSPGATPFANPGDLRAYLAADPANYNNVYAIDRFTNLGGIRVKTVNATIDYSVPTHGWGSFAVTSAMAYFISYRF